MLSYTSRSNFWIKAATWIGLTYRRRLGRYTRSFEADAGEFLIRILTAAH
ncbi:MAG TPA: hypothetical protein VIS96_13390 [Terrimicrobiaceae bacterium]